MNRRTPHVVAVILALAAVAGSAALFAVAQGNFRLVALNLSIALAHAVLFAALAWAAYFTGRVFFRVILKLPDPWWELELAVGFVVFSFAALGLAAAHLFYPWAVRGAVLGVLALSAPTAARLARAAFADLPGRWRQAGGAALFMGGAAALFAAVILLRAAAPPTDWDVLVYHLYVPQVYAAAHELVYMPRLVYASMPLLTEMAAAWAYQWDGVTTAAGVAPLMNVLLLVATYRLARRYLAASWAVAAAALVLAFPMFAATLPTSYVDGVAGAFGIMALAAYLKGFESKRDAVAAGVLLGAAFGVKYTSIYLALAFVPLVVADLCRRRLRLANAAVFIATAALLMAPWCVKAYVERGNPVFPVLYGVWGGRDLSAPVAAALERWQRGIGMGRDFVDYLLLPYRVSFEAGPSYPRFDGQLAPWALPLFALGLFWFRRWRLLAFGGVLFVAWAFIGSQQLRFLTPFFGVAAVVNAGVLSRAVEWAGGAARRALSAGLFLLIGFFTLAANAGFIAGGLDGWRYLMYRDSDVLLAARVPSYASFKFIDENLPGDAVILMLFENRLLYLNRAAVYDSFFEASETLYHVGALRTPEEVAAYVRELGATHILTSQPFAQYFRRYYQPSCRALWETYLERYTTVLAVVNEFEVREITPAAGAAAAP